MVTMRSFVSRLASALGLSAALLLAVSQAPAEAGQFRSGLTVKLVEYSLPSIARRGTLKELVYSGSPPPPYGYNYVVRMRVNGLCNRAAGVLLAGGRARGWVSGYDYGDPGTFPDDPYADAVAFVPYGGDREDGDWGVDTQCDRTREYRSGVLRVYRRASDYWWSDKGYYHVIDLHVCSDQLGCQWYAGYVRQIPQSLGSLGR